METEGKPLAKRVSMTDDNVILFDGITQFDLPADLVLQKALKEKLKGVVIVGVTEDGDEYFASSFADGTDCVWHLQRGVHKLMMVTDRLLEEAEE